MAVTGSLLSITAQNVFGSLIYNNIARYYTENENISIQFENKPLPKNVVLASFSSAPGQVGSYFVYIFGMVTLVSTEVIASRFESGFYSLLMMKGGQRFLYALSVYLTDVVVHLIVCSIVLGITYFSGILMRGIWLAYVIFSLQNPIFIMVIVYYKMFA